MKMTFDEFLNYIPYEFNLKLKSFIESEKDKQKDIITQSWLQAKLIQQAIVCAFNKDAEFPELQSLLEVKPKEPISPELLEAKVRMLNAAYGGQEIVIEADS